MSLGGYPAQSMSVAVELRPVFWEEFGEKLLPTESAGAPAARAGHGLGEG